MASPTSPTPTSPEKSSPSPMRTTAPVNSSAFSHSISIKLDEKNFLKWRQQVEGILHSHHFAVNLSGKQTSIPAKAIVAEQLIVPQADLAITLCLSLRKEGRRGLFLSFLCVISLNLVRTVIMSIRATLIRRNAIHYYMHGSFPPVLNLSYLECFHVVTHGKFGTRFMNSSNIISSSTTWTGISCQR